MTQPWATGVSVWIGLDFISATPMVVEPRVHYGGSGIVTVRSLGLIEMLSQLLR